MNPPGNSADVTMTPTEQIIQNMGRALEDAQSKISNLQNAMNSVMNSTAQQTPKLNKPMLFTGKQSIESWITHVRNYLRGIPDDKAISVALSYLGGPAHEWWLAQMRNGTQVTTLEEVFSKLKQRFTIINKEKLARDKLHRWKQMKDVSLYNEDFLKIVLDIPDISMEEQIDRYTRGLKSYIWRELCTKEYVALIDAMKDAERVESAYRRGGTGKQGNRREGNGTGPGPRGIAQAPVPMDIGNIRLQKLTAEERERCRREGLCFRCRQRGHMANDRRCPKNGNRN